MQWFSANNKHTIKLTSSVSREHNTSDIDASLGAYSFNSLADLEARSNAAFDELCRTLAVPIERYARPNSADQRA